MEELTFNIEDAKKRMTYVLLRKKVDYSNQNNSIEKNIQLILNDDEILEKLVVIQLTYDIRYMLRLFNTTSGYAYHMMNLLCSSIHGSVKVIAQRGLVIDYNLDGKPQFQKFNNSEELRAFLYDLVGFIYQPIEELYDEPEEEVIDPMISSNYNIVDALSFLGDLGSIEHVVTPKLKVYKKQK